MKDVDMATNPTAALAETDLAETREDSRDQYGSTTASRQQSKLQTTRQLLPSKDIY